MDIVCSYQVKSTKMGYAWMVGWSLQCVCVFYFILFFSCKQQRKSWYKQVLKCAPFNLPTNQFPELSLVLPHCTLDSGFQVGYLFGFKIQSILIFYFLLLLLSDRFLSVLCIFSFPRDEWTHVKRCQATSDYLNGWSVFLILFLCACACMCVLLENKRQWK